MAKKKGASSRFQRIAIDGHSLTLEKAWSIAAGAPICLHESVEKEVEASEAVVQKLLHSGRPTYGVNTGFGYLARETIPSQQLRVLQRNILRSHASGYGPALALAETRLAMALRLNVLVRGHAGVRYVLCQQLLDLINAEIYPVIPEYGSVGASGDLAPLAHLALPLIGEGQVHYQGRTVTAMEALLDAGISPIELSAKEGLSMINGTQVMLAIGSLALGRARSALRKADLIAALTFEGLVGNPLALDPSIHEARGQLGQIRSAKAMRDALEGSYLYNRQTQFPRVQDPYSLRCAPQIHGPAYEAAAHSCRIAEIELNASTDNPLVFSDSSRVLSGGNFHGQPLALAFDFAAMALSELANVSERRLELLLNPHHSGLPAFLTPSPGLNSGYMAMQYLSASLVNENKLLANPACTDSIPGNVGIEDHVSMGMTSARKLKRLITNVETVLASELLAAAQAIDLRRAGPLGYHTQQAYNKLRAIVPQLKDDRVIATDIEGAVNAFKEL